MRASHRWLKAASAACDACARSAVVFLRDLGHGLLEVSHNTLALVGLAVVAVLLFVAGRDDLRRDIETRVLGWLQARHGAQTEAEAETTAAAMSVTAVLPARPTASAASTAVPISSALAPTPSAPALPATVAAAVSPPAAPMSIAPTASVTREGDAVSRATAADPRELTRQQAAVAHWLARRYRVAPEPISRLVKEAWNLAPRFGLDPTLVLAIMAVESSFNPFAQSSVGAQGLMQVMTSVHNGKYERFGGHFAAFDPVTNLKVGVQVLRECIARAGSIEAGLRFYVGAANLSDDGGYAGKVLAEQAHLRDVASGKAVAPTARAVARAPVAAAPLAVPVAPPKRGEVPVAPAPPVSPTPASRGDANDAPAPSSAPAGSGTPAEERSAPEQVAIAG